MAYLPVDVLWIARYDYDAGWSLRLHRHDYLQMIFFLDGKGVFSLSGKKFDVHGGELFLIPADETHGLRAETQMRTLDVKFRVAAGPLARNLSRAPKVMQWSGPNAVALLERIRTEGELKSQWYRELCSVLMTEVLYLYLRHNPDGTFAGNSAAATGVAMRDPVLQRAFACIKAEYRRPLTIQEIAGACGCTDRTLRLHFQNVLRMRPLAFLQGYRIEQAKALICFSDYALKDIARQVGFQTVHHFTRQFAALEKRSPAAWRQEYLEGIRKDIYINPKFENRILTVKD
jgi:AraC-like DNA-binding protein